MKLRRALPPLLAAVAVTAVLAGVVGTDAAVTESRPAPPAAVGTLAAAAPGERIRAATWNICAEAGGAFGTSAYCPHRADPDAKADAVKRLVDEQQLNVVMLQEMCSGPLVLNQAAASISLLDRIKTRLGTGWSVAWAEMQRPDGRSDCRGGLGGTLGVAIAVQGTITMTTRRPLPVPHKTRADGAGYSQPTVLCAKVSGWATEVCTAHLVNSDIGEAAYLAEVSALNNFVFGRPADAPQVVLGGDLNTRQWGTWLKTLHDKYPECDEVSHGSGDTVREPTIGGTDGGKIDYLFASAGFTACDVLTTGYQDTLTSATPDGYSDHAPVVGVTAALP
ncbi:endonuclease/exonuclease/phosphatase family protein [Actinoplanes sp. GCM10030250]|uniref:endonuclease/exonuclease/phosphatase family protein n=1 Tax=Actinoplanes sp. GCM10030250 TaxID=3273376 RepID=UPI003609178B